MENVTEPTAAPLYGRPRVVDILVLSTSCAVVFAVETVIRSLRDSLWEREISFFYDGLYALMNGLVLGGAALVLWRRFQGPPRSAWRPGHLWLLFFATVLLLRAITGATTVAMASVLATDYMVWNWEHFLLCLCVGGTCLVFSVGLASGRLWRLAFGLPMIPLFALTWVQAAALIGIWRPWYWPAHLWSEAVIGVATPALAFVAWRRDPPADADWLHTVGVLSVFAFGVCAEFDAWNLYA